MLRCCFTMRGLLMRLSLRALLGLLMRLSLWALLGLLVLLSLLRMLRLRMLRLRMARRCCRCMLGRNRRTFGRRMGRGIFACGFRSVEIRGMRRGTAFDLTLNLSWRLCVRHLSCLAILLLVGSTRGRRMRHAVAHGAVRRLLGLHGGPIADCRAGRSHRMMSLHHLEPGRTAITAAS